MPNRSHKKDKANEFSLIPQSKLLELYSWTVRCRLLGELLEGVPQAVPPRDLEAAAVAVCLDLKPGDEVVSVDCEFLPAFVRHRKLDAALGALREPAASVAARMNEVLAAARQAKQANAGSLVAVFGAGRVARSTAWKNALRAANSETLPVILVHILDAEAEASGHDEHGFPAIPADVHDVVALYRVAAESFAHARHGHGATLIECIPWALEGEEHNDAVLNFERFLAARGIATERTRAAVKAGFARSVRQAASSARLRATPRRFRRA